MQFILKNIRRVYSCYRLTDIDEITDSEKFTHVDFLGNLKHQTLCNLHGNMYVEIPYKFSAIPPLPNGRGLLAEVSR